jgi:hypothetical protein
MHWFYRWVEAVIFTFLTTLARRGKYGSSMNQGDGEHGSSHIIFHARAKQLRSTVLIFQFINMLLNTSTAVTYHLPIPGLFIFPLPIDATLWNAQDFGDWSKEFVRSYTECIVYGLSDAGELTKFEKNDVGVYFSPAEWDEWIADVGDIGTLVMVIGSLLNMENK